MLIEFDSTAWLIGLTALVVPLIVLRGRGGFYLFFFSIFWVYLLVLVSVTVFPFSVGMDAGFRYPSIWAQLDRMLHYSGMNLLPLYFGNCWDLPRACAIGIQENILMTVPFGFGINFIAHPRRRDFVWLAFGLGLLIETTQLALDLILGGVYRSVDVNDVLFNGLGVLIGYGLFLVFAWLFMITARLFKPGQIGLLTFIQDACRAGLAGTGTSSETSSTKANIR